MTGDFGSDVLPAFGNNNNVAFSLRLSLVCKCATLLPVDMLCMVGHILQSPFLLTWSSSSLGKPGLTHGVEKTKMWLLNWLLSFSLMMIWIVYFLCVRPNLWLDAWQSPESNASFLIYAWVKVLELSPWLPETHCIFKQSAFLLPFIKLSLHRQQFKPYECLVVYILCISVCEQ